MSTGGPDYGALHARERQQHAYGPADRLDFGAT